MDCPYFDDEIVVVHLWCCIRIDKLLEAVRAWRQRNAMKVRIHVSIIALLAILIGAGTTFAHHGTASYDTNTIVTVKGTMTEFRFINPHVQLFFDVKNDKGELEKWQAELTAPNKLSRAGWDKHTLKPGDSITASGYVSRNDSHTMWINKLIGPDGEALHLFEE
jgi:hypothetical protein